ncbi:MAG: glutaminase domain-containing protein [Terriglobia bacterium]
MQKRILAVAILLTVLSPALAQFPRHPAAVISQKRAAFRPPAVPLVAVDPYFSIWSFADHLTYDTTRHWTGTPMAMQSLVRVDGKTYRIMGKNPSDVQPARQISLQVFPTRTVYKSEAGGVGINLTFLTPDLPHDLDILSRPVTYLTWTAKSLDGRPHAVSIFYDNSAELVVNTPDELVTWSSEKKAGLSVLKMGTVAQPILSKAGDRIRIDWGYLYAAAPRNEAVHGAALTAREVIRSFTSKGSIPDGVSNISPPVAATGHAPVMAFAFNLGSVGARPVSRHLILAYDEIYPIEYFHQRLKPWWQHGGATIDDLLDSAEHDYPQLAARSQTFDQKLMADLTRSGGPEYAQVAALAYRQAFAANKLAIGPHGEPLMFLKEISSCGCAQTADVIYPESPILLLVNPKLLEYSLVPLLDYAQSGKWPYPYAPHDLGTYPIDNARVPSQMESMPVEETGNMLLMIAGIAKAEGSASFAARYWPLLTQWADYLKKNGLDPGNQLCTDDFTGLLAHNANLSLKAVEALGSYAMLANMLGKKQEAGAYRATARDYAGKWMKLANDGNHTRLAYDRPGTWSQKYNLVWDRVLGINLFPPSLARNELAYYKAHATHFGFPLDSRSAFTKLDWESWSATLAGSDAEFRSLFSGLYNFANQTPTRVPLSDWYWTVDGSQTGFQARPVVGGIYMKMLANPAIWIRWASGKE